MSVFRLSVMMAQPGKQAVILKHGVDVQTDCVCHDFLWIRFTYFMGKGFYWMAFSDRRDGKRLQFN